MPSTVNALEYGGKEGRLRKNNGKEPHTLQHQDQDRPYLTTLLTRMYYSKVGRRSQSPD